LKEICTHGEESPPLRHSGRNTLVTAEWPVISPALNGSRPSAGRDPVDTANRQHAAKAANREPNPASLLIDRLLYLSMGTTAPQLLNPGCPTHVAIIPRLLILRNLTTDDVERQRLVL
jgi:hypothetical protein